MGAAMGWTVHDVKRSSIWEFFAAWHGYVDANTPKGGNKLSAAEKAELWADVEAYGLSAGKTLTTQTYWWDENGPVPMGVVCIPAN